MTIFFKHIRRWITAVRLPLALGAGIVVSLIAPRPALAGLFDMFSPSGVIGIFMTVIGSVIAFVGGLIIWFASEMFGIMLNFNYHILDQSNTIVDIGWKISRDIANLGFVVVIIAIAIATIVRYKEYDAKKFLVKLIVMAIVINFSLAIAGIVIDFSNTLTRFFLDRVINEPAKIAQKITGAFGPQRYFVQSDPPPPDPQEQLGGVGEFTTAVMTSITGLIFSIIFTYLTAFVLLVLAWLFLLRYFHLSFLLVVLPIVLLTQFIPTQDQWSKWQKDFIQWTLFAPAAAFFIYLALRVVEVSGKTPFIFNDVGGGVIGPVLSQGMQAVITGALMLGGLMAANSMGIKGAGAAQEYLDKKKKGVQKWAGQKAKQKALTFGAGKDPEGKTRLEKIAGGKFFNTSFARTTGLTRAATGLATASSNAKAGGKKDVDPEADKIKNQTKNVTKADLVDIGLSIQAAAGMNDAKLLALAMKAMKDGTWNDLKKDQADGGVGQENFEKIQNRVVKAARSNGMQEDVAGTNPELGEKLGLDEKKMEKIISKSEDVSKLPPELIAKYSNVLTPKHVEQIGDVSPQDINNPNDPANQRRRAVYDKVKSTLTEDSINFITEHRRKLDDIADEIDLAKAGDDKDVVKNLTEQRTQLKQELANKLKVVNNNREQRNALKLFDAMVQNPNYDEETPEEPVRVPPPRRSKLVDQHEKPFPLDGGGKLIT